MSDYIYWKYNEWLSNPYVRAMTKSQRSDYHDLINIMAQKKDSGGVSADPEYLKKELSTPEEPTTDEDIRVILDRFEVINGILFKKKLKDNTPSVFANPEKVKWLLSLDSIKEEFSNANQWTKSLIRDLKIQQYELTDYMTEFFGILENTEEYKAYKNHQEAKKHFYYWLKQLLEKKAGTYKKPSTTEHLLNTYDQINKLRDAEQSAPDNNS